MAQEYCENASATGVPNYLIFVRPVACGPWPRARITQKRVCCYAENIVVASRRSGKPRLLLHLSLLKLLPSYGLGC